MTKRSKRTGSARAGFQVGPGIWVRLHFSVRDGDGEPVLTEAEELGYVHGHGQLLPDLEAALEGASAGQTVAIKLGPDRTFGERRAERVLTVSREEFPEDVTVGDHFEADGEGAFRLVLRVLDVSEASVLVDTNHPLAGQALEFSLEIQEVRPATEAELRAAETRLAAPSPGSAPLISVGSLLRGRSRR